MTYMSKIELHSNQPNVSEMSVRSRERLLRLPDVMERVGLKKTAIYTLMRAGKFPRSRTLGARYVVWVESEIDDWVRDAAST